MGEGKREQWIALVIVPQSYVHIYVLDFISFSVLRLILYVNLVTQSNLLFSCLGTVVRSLDSGLERLRVLPQWNPNVDIAFVVLLISSRLFSGGYSSTGRLNNALILTPYQATNILFLTCFDLLDTSYFSLCGSPYITRPCVWRKSTCHSQEL